MLEPEFLCWIHGYLHVQSVHNILSSRVSYQKLK
uniref:Uncharacterized protein n=1 Tax=Rhizophora mucronata TaxID=61149 RepID=A0A2P2PZW5_RHIMU